MRHRDTFQPSRTSGPIPTRMTDWLLLPTGMADGATNMARDEVAMELARRTGSWTLRVYGWSRPTVSFGRHQKALAGYAPEALDAAGVDVVRRPTGGRAILHDHEVTYCVTAPHQAGALSLGASYEAINDLLLDTLARLGVTAERAGAAGRVVPPGLAPCFDVPTPGELVLGGRKLVGSAQWRDETAFLQHGSILIEDDQPALASLARVPVPAPPPAATLRAALRRVPSLEEVAESLRTAVRALHRAEPYEWTDDARVLVAERAAHHRDPAWIWRR